MNNLLQPQKVTRLFVIIAIGFLVAVGDASTYTKDCDAIDGFVVDDFQVNNVPLPSAIWLFASALLGLLGVNRKSQ